MSKNIIYIFSIFVLASCSQNKYINEDYENFNYFIVKFFAIEEFQKERTIFPLEYSYYENYPDKIKTIIINKDNWEALIDTVYVSSHYFRNIYDNFEHELRNTNKRVFAYEGNETGTAIYYYFELKDKKWLHTKREDFSD
jgi:hypothetical protein